MKRVFEFIEVNTETGMDAQPVSFDRSGYETVVTFRFSWTDENAEKNEKFKVRWQFPAIGTMYHWTPVRAGSKNLQPDWAASWNSLISGNAPLSVLYDGKGNARYVWQLSECQKEVSFHTGVREEDGEIECRFEFGTKQFTNLHETYVTIRIDEEVRPTYEAIPAAAKWWEDACNIKPAFIPEDAFDPCYSFWYSFHQGVYEEAVERECKLAKALGFDDCIIDDGWQTDDNSRGYAYCGDWEVAPSKIKDMAAHVKRVHDIGLKYILWYSVPLLGINSKHYEHFKDMVLNENDRYRLNCVNLDPRYKEVRDFLINIYVKALKEWDLDGFKLDFIDHWVFSENNAPYNEKMDIASLADASQTFLAEATAALKAIKPDILLEFRQSYIGPLMREYGNMFRVGDCPDDYITNRVGIFDLRMTMGKSAVHSDMLMWHPEEKPETAALQIISVIYGVIQYSAKLDRLTPEMKRMSLNLLNFARAHKNALLKGKLKVYEPHLSYTWAQGMDEEENIVTVYAIDKCVKPDLRDRIYLLNGAESERILVELEGKFHVITKDCYGRVLSEEDRELMGVNLFDVPTGGLVELRK